MEKISWSKRMSIIQTTSMLFSPLAIEQHVKYPWKKLPLHSQHLADSLIQSDFQKFTRSGSKYNMTHNAVREKLIQQEYVSRDFKKIFIWFWRPGAVDLLIFLNEKKKRLLKPCKCIFCCNSVSYLSLGLTHTHKLLLEICKHFTQPVCNKRRRKKPLRSVAGDGSWHLSLWSSWVVKL